MSPAFWGGGEELVQWSLLSLLWHGSKGYWHWHDVYFTFVIDAHIIPLDWLQALCD
jgi:hypothetical protein